MTRALTLHQPWASLVALGVKSIETRSWSTNYRGRLLIHAGATLDGLKAIQSGSEDGWSVGELYGDPRRVYCWQRAYGQPIVQMYDGADGPFVLPLGVVVASCFLVDVVPMVEWGADPQANHLTIGSDGRLRSYEFVNGSAPMAWRKRDPFDVTDQLPFGDFAPGRYAWLLEDIQPTSVRCPACWGPGCHVCSGAGRCDPVPARGRQQLWNPAGEFDNAGGEL